MQVSLNIWSIREYFTTSSHAQASLMKLKNLGFHAVELCHSPDMLGTLELSQLCADLELAVSGIHDTTVIENPESAAQRAMEANCKFVTFPYPGERDLTHIDVVRKLASDLEYAAEVLAQHGLSLSYHNHDMEFQFCGKPRVLDILIENTSLLEFQLDLYWVHAAQQDPLKWCHKLNERLTQLHLKDFRSRQGAPESCPLGMGEIDFSEILIVADHPQLTIEQEHFHNDPFQDFGYSLNHLLQLELS